MCIYIMTARQTKARRSSFDIHAKHKPTHNATRYLRVLHTYAVFGVLGQCNGRHSSPSVRLDRQKSSLVLTRLVKIQNRQFFPSLNNCELQFMNLYYCCNGVYSERQRKKKRKKEGKGERKKEKELIHLGESRFFRSLSKNVI